MRRLILREEAEGEVEHAFHWYEDQSPGLGAEFLHVLEAALAAIQRNPEAFPLKYRSARQAVLRRFPYSLIFIIQVDGSVEVISCFHARRDPRRWRSRTPHGT